MVFLLREKLVFTESAVIGGQDERNIRMSDATKPDYGSGPYLVLMAAAIRLARLDLANPALEAEARAWLRSDLVSLFADCIGYEGVFDA